MKPHLALSLSLLPATNLLADTFERDQALKLPDVVISANRQVEARNDSSAANTVFTRDDIERLQPASVTDLLRSEEHTSELQSLMRTSYAVFCLKKKTNN